jgi:hypothetical protein
MSDDDFFEEDEPVEKIQAQFEAGEKFVTKRPPVNPTFTFKRTKGIVYNEFEVHDAPEMLGWPEHSEHWGIAEHAKPFTPVLAHAHFYDDRFLMLLFYGPGTRGQRMHLIVGRDSSQGDAPVPEWADSLTWRDAGRR